MNLDELRAFPTTYQQGRRGGCGRDPKCYRCWECEREDRETASQCHESLLRSYQVLKKAEAWLEAGAPATVVLEMIRFAYSREDGP